MANQLTKREAIVYLGLDPKTFSNYFTSAAEFPCLPRKTPSGRFFFDESVLRDWKESYHWRTENLSLNDYALCLDFALAKHFTNYVTSDFGTGRQREFGQKITNWIKGQLGEIAVSKFFQKEFGVKVQLDFEIRPGIVRQDIIAVEEGGKMRAPKIGVGIKSSKPKNAYLILSENEIGVEGRISDVYIFCRPAIPDDHLLRISKEKIIEIVKTKPHYSKYKELMPNFTDIPCEVAGWCFYRELEKVTQIPGQNFDGIRWVRQSGMLRKSKESWRDLIKML
jgi:hypothetical protein